MNLSGFPALISATVDSCAQTAADIANTQPINAFDASVNNLSSADVDAILIALDGNGILNGTVDLSGQVPPAPPTASGRIAAANLVADGWTVTLDEIDWAPNTEVVSWNDSGGPNSGNLAAFLGAADFDTVTDLTFGATGLLTSISGLQCLPALSLVDLTTNAVVLLDMRNCLALNNLQCAYNALTNLNVSNCTSLATVNCGYNPITILNVAGCTGLVNLYCSNTSLTTLDVSTCSSLATLICNNSSLTNLNAVGCTALTTLYCGYNSLTSLNLTNLAALALVDCTQNSLTTLIVAGCTNLNSLTVTSNNLATGAGGYVNIVLADMVTNAAPAGTIDITLQTPIAPPDAGPPDGAAAKTTLIGLGWGVLTD